MDDPRSAMSPVHVERLEPRTLLTAVVQDNVLLVTGTDADDVIAVNSRDNGATIRVSVNGQRSYFDASTVNSVKVSGLRGRDHLEAGAEFAKPVQFAGGAGADTLIGGAANDTLDGQNG